MAGIPYIGASQASPRDLVNYGYVQSLFANNLTQSAVDALINTGLSNYVLKSYVDSQDVLNATKAFIDAGDATRLKLAQIGAANGAVPLNVSGRIDVSRVSAGSTQRYPQSFYSPSAYATGNVTVTTTETQLYTYALPSPGFTYKLWVSGLQDVFSNTDGEMGIVLVRVGSMTGPIIAGAYGLAETYVAGALTSYTTAGTFTYTIPGWAGSVDAVCLGGGGGGQNGYIAFFISQPGQGGLPGSWGTASLVHPSSLPTSTNSLTVTVGAGGAGGSGAGSASTVAGAGVTTVTGAGSAGQRGDGITTGQAPAPQVFNGVTYTGATSEAALATPGNPPGGGGGGGTSGYGAGFPGASGAVFLFARPVSGNPSGSIPIISTPFNNQTAMTGAKTLYVTLLRSGSASTQVATTVSPKLFVVPIPA